MESVMGHLPRLRCARARTQNCRRIHATISTTVDIPEPPSTPGRPAAANPAAFPPRLGGACGDAGGCAPPTRYDGPAAWTGAEMRERDDWIVRLSEADRGELDAAWRATAYLPIEATGPREFALPTLGASTTKLRICSTFSPRIRNSMSTWSSHPIGGLQCPASQFTRANGQAGCCPRPLRARDRRG